MTIVPFPRFRPDQSRFSPEASASIINAQPTKDGWAPMPSLMGLGTALPSAPRGAIAVKNDAGVWQIFAGTATNLYRFNSSTYAPAEISRITNDYDLPDSEFWTFIQFGNYLIATALGSDYPQFVNLATSDDFANLTNATFEARTGWVTGDFLVFGQIAGNRRKLKWSGVNDMTFWTVGQRGSDEQVLPDGGDIQFGIPQAPNALIIQETSIRQMLFAPDGGLVFSFVMVDPVRGAFAPRSVVNIGPGDFVYLAKDGFYRGLEGKPIGAERVDRWFFATCASNKYDLVSGVADPYAKVIWWRFEDSTGANSLLGYDWQLDEWMYTTNDAVELLAAATPGYTMVDLDAFGTLEALLYPLDSRFWKGGIPGFAGFTAGFKFGFLDGTNLEATLTTERKMLNWPKRAVTGKIQVLVDTDASQVAIAAAETQNGALSFGAYRAQETSLPWVSSRISGKWHQFKIKIPAGTTWTNAIGIDVAFSDGGMR